MDSLSFSHPLQKRGFTLVELLVVVSIIALLIGLTLPAVEKVTQGHQLTDMANRLAALIERARSHATTTQRVVAVRLFEGASDREYNRVMLMEISPHESDPEEVRSEALTPLLRFPAEIIVSTPLSSVLDADVAANGNGPLPGGSLAPYREFLIFPNGTTSLPATSINPYLCVAIRVDAERGSGILNPHVVSIDPITSRVTLYRK